MKKPKLVLVYNIVFSRPNNISTKSDIGSQVEYSDKQREAAIRNRLKNIIDQPKPDYPEQRKPGYITTKINGIKVIVLLEPYAKNVTQWKVTINGELFSKHCGMNQVYRELARLNPPARNFY